MRAFILSLILSSVAIGCGQNGKTLGKAPKEPNTSVLAIYAGDAPTAVTVQGTMVEKCPQAGCWFKLNDGDRVIKIDTKAAGFVVTDVPLNTKMVVAGKVARVGNEQLIQASGLRF